MAKYRTPIPALLAATLQSGLNAVLALDTETSDRLRRLEGRVLKLVFKGAGITFYFKSGAGSGTRGVEVALDSFKNEGQESEDDADTTISGTPAALFSMAASEMGGGWAAPNSKVNISGDAGLARDFEHLFSRLDPDIESALAGLFGDVVGHQLAFGMKQGAQRARETATAAREVLGDVLREGARGGRSGPLVGSGEARSFADGVDELRDAVDRLEARIRMLAETGEDSR